MKQLWHVFSGIKTFLIVTTGAIIGSNIINKNYGSQTIGYLMIGLFGYTFFSMFEEWIKKNGR